MPEGLTLGASGLVSRQMKRGDRGSVPASRTFAEMFECEASGRDSGDCDATAWVRRANGWTRCFEKGAKFPLAPRAQTEGRAVALCRR